MVPIEECEECEGEERAEQGDERPERRVQRRRDVPVRIPVPVVVVVVDQLEHEPPTKVVLRVNGLKLLQPGRCALGDFIRKPPR